MYAGKQQGVTLLELLIALSIFTFISAAIFVAMQSAVNSYSVFQRTGQRQAQLQSMLSILTQDIMQMVPRVIRDKNNDYLPAFSLKKTDYLLEFSRTGLPLETTVSGLQRVAYQFIDGNIIRYAWSYMDRLPTTKAVETELATNIAQIDIQVIDENIQEHENWPPTDIDNEQNQLLLLPQAVVIKITLEDMGEIERTIPGVSNIFLGVEDEDRQKTDKQQNQ